MWTARGGGPRRGYHSHPSLVGHCGNGESIGTSVRTSAWQQTADLPMIGWYGPGGKASIWKSQRDAALKCGKLDQGRLRCQCLQTHHGSPRASSPGRLPTCSCPTFATMRASVAYSALSSTLTRLLRTTVSSTKGGPS